jgi:hypothetical protein
MANLAVLAGREVRESKEGVRNGIAYGAAWLIVDRLLAPGEAGFANITEASNALRSVPKLFAALEAAENERPIGAVIECGPSARAGKLWIPKAGPEISGMVYGHAAILSTEDVPQVVRFVTVNGPQGLVHIRVSPKEGEGRRPSSPDQLQEMVHAAYRQTVQEYPWWLEVSLGVKAPNFVGITRVGQVGSGPRVAEQAPSGLTGRALADAFASAYKDL